MFAADDNGRFDKNLARSQFGSNVENIVHKYRSASPEMVQGGHDWYNHAHEVAAKIGQGNVERGAGVIAALSPQTGWGRNLHLAHELMTTGTTKHTKDSIVKAQRIREGEHPLEVLGGQKVRSFYQNISNPNDPHVVTVDRHAHDIAIGIPFRGTAKAAEKAPNLGLGAKGRYEHFSEAYKAAAHELGVEHPHKVQATTWVTHRGAIG
jgi:hypothetical protein